jgi:hypothetical protein
MLKTRLRESNPRVTLNGYLNAEKVAKLWLTSSEKEATAREHLILQMLAEVEPCTKF